MAGRVCKHTPDGDNASRSIPSGSHQTRKENSSKQEKDLNVKPLKQQTAMGRNSAIATGAASAASANESIHAIIACVKTSDFSKSEICFASHTGKIYRIAPDFSKIESSAITVYPSILEKVLCDPEICNASADFSEYLANLGEDVSERSLSKILANADVEFNQTPDHKEHDFFRVDFLKIELTEKAIAKIRRYNEENGEL